MGALLQEPQSVCRGKNTPPSFTCAASTDQKKQLPHSRSIANTLHEDTDQGKKDEPVQLLCTRTESKNRQDSYPGNLENTKRLAGHNWLEEIRQPPRPSASTVCDKIALM